MASRKVKLRHIKEYPHIKQKWLDVCEELLRQKKKFDDAEDMFNWWIQNLSMKNYQAEKLFKLKI